MARGQTRSSEQLPPVPARVQTDLPEQFPEPSPLCPGLKVEEGGDEVQGLLSDHLEGMAFGLKGNRRSS